MLNGIEVQLKEEVVMKLVRLSLLFAALFVMHTQPAHAWGFGGLTKHFGGIGKAFSHAVSGVKNRIGGMVSSCGQINGEKPGRAMFHIAVAGGELSDKAVIAAHGPESAKKGHIDRSKGHKSKGRSKGRRR